MVKTVLMDPYTPIHLYSGILPIKSLQLPLWTMQKPMKNMSKWRISPDRSPGDFSSYSAIAIVMHR
jgi:hypothetical protein